MILDINDPKNFYNISIFQDEPLGASLYFSCPPYETLQFMRCEGSQRQLKNKTLSHSDTFYTFLAMNSSVNIYDYKKIFMYIIINYRKLDKLDNLFNCYQEKRKNSKKMQRFVHLFRFF